MLKVAEAELLDWSGRVMLVDSICDFILLCPKVGQVISLLLIFFFLFSMHKLILLVLTYSLIICSRC